MKKRTFLKKGGAFVLGSTLFSFCSNPSSRQETLSTESISGMDTPGARTNWAGNLEYATDVFYKPSTVEELQELVRSADQVRPLGTTHCFNPIADSKHGQITVREFDTNIEIDEGSMTATINAGASYGQICKELYQQGFALHNLASLPHISVAGAIATATHGSGVTNGNLGSAISAMEFIDANGELHSLSRKEHQDLGAGIITHLGCLGVITRLTLDLKPKYEVAQQVFLNLPVSNLLDNFLDVMSGGYSVSLFTDYQSDTVNQVWVKSKEEANIGSGDDYYGAIPADRDVHPIIEISAENCTKQLGVAGPWYDRLPHFRMEFTPSSGKELQSEFFVPAKHAVEAFEFISTLKDQLKPVLMISEIRSIAADDQWMSPFYKQDSIAFHFTWEQDREGVEKVLPIIQNGLEPYGVKPHWGKVFTIAPEKIRSLYPNLSKFKAAVQEFDPNGKFRNEFVNTLFY